MKEQENDIEVFYVRAHCCKTSVELPANDCLQVSSNNVDGFNVTVW